ncbi:MAG TPA: LEA type 2 family protein [Sphingobacteriaceae bacterium]
MNFSAMNFTSRNFTMMKKLMMICAVAFSVGACGINKQMDQLQAFEKCRYEITSADSVYLGNVDITELVGRKEFNLARVPSLMLAVLRQDVPLKAKINLRIENPAGQVAAINQFEYKILHKTTELATGFVNQKVSVQPGGVTVVPIQVNSNIYDLLSDPENQKAFADFISEGKSGEKKTVLTVKIKPTLDIGNNQIKYPGYITVNKEITSKILF